MAHAVSNLRVAPVLAPLIIGGGPSGAAAACVLAAAGHAVTLLERQAGPSDKLCGDFLSGGAVAAVRALGLEPLTLGAMPLQTIRLVHRRSVAEADLPFAAMGLSRRTLDDALLRRAAQCGATVRRGQAVHGLQATPAGFAVRAGGLGTLESEAVFLATGKHDLRGLARAPQDDGLLGLKMYYRLAPPQADALFGCVEMFLLRHGYAGLQLVDGNRAVLCALLPAERYRRAGCRWDTLLDGMAAEAPALIARLVGASACLDQPLAIARTPYGHLHRTNPASPPGLFRLGDQACVVPSLAGDGMAIALHSGIAAAAAWMRSEGAAGYHASLARAANRPLRFAGLLHAACLSPATQALAVAGCRAWPPALRWAASLSRVARGHAPHAMV